MSTLFTNQRGRTSRNTTNYVSVDKAAINNTNSEGRVKQEVEKPVEMLSFCLTFVVRQLPDDPGLLMSVQVDVQNVTKSLWVQVTTSSDHPRWRQSTLPPGNMGHDVNWTQKKRHADPSGREWAAFGLVRSNSLAPTWLWGDDHDRIRTEARQMWDDSSVHVNISLDHAHVGLLAAPCVGGDHDDSGAGRGRQI